MTREEVFGKIDELLDKTPNNMLAINCPNPNDKTIIRCVYRSGNDLRVVLSMEKCVHDEALSTNVGEVILQIAENGFKPLVEKTYRVRFAVETYIKTTSKEEAKYIFENSVLNASNCSFIEVEDITEE